jgi:hypothetical protein
MKTIDVQLINSLPGQKKINGKSNIDGRIGFWGVVTELHPEDMCVDVLMDVGIELPNVRVSSLDWVTMDNDDNRNSKFLSGTRNLPPKGTLVFCLMPTGQYSDAFILCSGFAMKDSMGGGISEFKEKSEDAKYIRKHISNSGWSSKKDRRTGTVKIYNSPREGNETIRIEVDQGEKGNEKVTITIHGNIFTIDKENGIHIKSDKNLSEDVTGNAEYKSSNTDIKSIQPVGINGGGKNLNAGCLKPYWSAETEAWTALQTIVANPFFKIQMAQLDGSSGGFGSIIALASGLIALCSDQIAAESSAKSTSSSIIK